MPGMVISRRCPECPGVARHRPPGTLLDAGLLVHDLEQPVVGDDDQRVHAFLQPLDPIFGHARRRAPSNVNGLVTTPMVSAPDSLAACDHGARPCPCRRPCRRSRRSCRCPSQRLDLVRGLLGRFLADHRIAAGAQPFGELVADAETLRRLASINAWASVLMEMNSTPRIPCSIMRLTALEPPPPMPSTLIWAGFSTKADWGPLVVMGGPLPKRLRQISGSRRLARDRLG